MHRIKSKNALLFLFLLCGMLFSCPALAADNPAVVIILDASGSMLEKAGSELKIDVARKVLHEVLPSLPEQIDVGLVAYGHRRKGDCDDIETICALGSGNRTELLKKANAIKPKGMTPLAAAVEQVMNELKERETETAIILVSDGKDTCSPDPCAAVKKLRESGVRFVLHVVGFGVGSDEQKQLECMAAAGGGSFFAAKDTNSLLAAFREMQKDVETRFEITPVQAQQVSKTSQLAKLRIVVPEESQKSLAEIRVLGEDGSVVKTIEKPKADSTHALPSGSYTLAYCYETRSAGTPRNKRHELPTYEETVALEGGERVAELGALFFNLAERLDEAVYSVTLRSSEEGGFTLTTTENTVKKRLVFRPKPLPEGSYDVLLTFGNQGDQTPLLLAKDLKIEKGKPTVLEYATGILVKEPKDERSVLGWDLVPTGQETPLLTLRRRGSTSSGPLWLPIMAPAGSYDLLFHVKGMDQPLKVGEGVEIKEGELVTFDPGM